MKRGNLRWNSAALLAFIMGIPMAEPARAESVGGGVFGIVDAAIALALSIVDVAGDS